MKFTQYKPKQADLKEYYTAFQNLFLAVYGTRLATICALDGHALGGGCILALMFDSRVMQDGARIGMNEAEFGLAAPNWAMSLLRNTVGQRAAEKALSTGMVFESGAL